MRLRSKVGGPRPGKQRLRINSREHPLSRSRVCLSQSATEPWKEAIDGRDARVLSYLAVADLVAGCGTIADFLSSQASRVAEAQAPSPNLSL